MSFWFRRSDHHRQAIEGILLTWATSISERACPEVHLCERRSRSLHHARASVVAAAPATVQARVIGILRGRLPRLPAHLSAGKRLVRYPPEIWNPTQVDRTTTSPLPGDLIAGGRIVPRSAEPLHCGKLAAALHPSLHALPSATG